MSRQDMIDAARANIGKYGWHCLSVGPRPGETGARFTYTVGLTETFGHPELMIFGLDNKLSHGLLGDCVEMIRTGTVFQPDTPYSRILGGGHDVVFRRANGQGLREYFALAGCLYGDAGFQGLVLFWPDPAGRFPWDETASAAQREALAIVA